MGHYFFTTQSIFGWIFMLLIIYLIFWRRSYSNEQKRKTPEEILKERFAKGEINKEEYEESINLLKENR